MWDENGPRGGVDKRCQVALHAEGAGPWSSPPWRATGARPSTMRWRAARFLLRQWRRGSDTRRMRQRLPEPV
jgi:hypothetical protein